MYHFKNVVIALIRDMWSMYFYDMNIDMVFYYCIVISFISRKIFKAYYGFRVLYVFPFPSAGHWPLDFGSWHDAEPVSEENKKAEEIEQPLQGAEDLSGQHSSKPDDEKKLDKGKAYTVEIWKDEVTKEIQE